MANVGAQVDQVSPAYGQHQPLPDFQALPSSITAAQLMQPTKVEYFPKEEQLPAIDLKGHTVEELASAAGVSVEVIKSAIKLRQQQMMTEKKNLNVVKRQQWKPPKASITPPTTSSESFEEFTTQSTTARPTTTAYVPKKKASKKPLKNGHKVRNLTRL